MRSSKRQSSWKLQPLYAPAVRLDLTRFISIASSWTLKISQTIEILFDVYFKNEGKENKPIPRQNNLTSRTPTHRTQRNTRHGRGPSITTSRDEADDIGCVVYALHRNIIRPNLQYPRQISSSLLFFDFSEKIREKSEEAYESTNRLHKRRPNIRPHVTWRHGASREYHGEGFTWEAEVEVVLYGGGEVAGWEGEEGGWDDGGESKSCEGDGEGEEEASGGKWEVHCEIGGAEVVGGG